MKTDVKRWPVAITMAVLVAGMAIGLGFGISTERSSPSTHMGPEGVLIANVPDLGSAGTTAPGTPVDGITCRRESDQVVKWHTHSHVAIYVHGSLRRLPAGIGITPPRLTEHFANGTFYDVGINDCLYWLHTHAYDDIVHTEAPYKHTFTLGQFFDIWRQSLGPDQVGPAKGHVVAFVNGKRFTGNPRDIPLLKHSVIQIDVGSPVVPFHPFTYKVTGLCAAGSNSCSVSKPAG
ncbi:MAG: hypothetical protein M1399_07620 [Actinobacteria bacterium]|nr:hypothetical protein [Actinomycetota bacterium]MCL5447048.1 hypothetical protein [Actinomycetota bacterium]